MSRKVDWMRMSSWSRDSRRFARKASAASRIPAIRFCSARGGRGIRRLRVRLWSRFEMFVVWLPNDLTLRWTFADENQRYRYVESSRASFFDLRIEIKPPAVLGYSSDFTWQHLPTRFQLFALETRMSPGEMSFSGVVTRLPGTAIKSDWSSVSCTFLVLRQATAPSSRRSHFAVGLNVIPRISFACLPRASVFTQSLQLLRPPRDLRRQRRQPLQAHARRAMLRGVVPALTREFLR